MATTIAEILNVHLAQHDWSFERLGVEARLPRSTVYRWKSDGVSKIRHWQDLAKAAQALTLNRSQTDALLAAGGHPSIEVLLKRVEDEENRELLTRWSVTSLNNLPAQLTSFVGREEGIERLTRLLASARLLTLTGTGGSGKTRLALELAHAVLDEFEEAHFVDLASVRDPERVIPTIAQTLDLRESLAEPPLRALQTYLRDRRVLLVLDNFEQVIDAAPRVKELVQAAPRVKALVTSRTRLNVQGEHEVTVPPLSLPDAASGFDELARNPSVALFAERARAVNAAFALTPDSAPLVAELCVRLDGLPLGIELVAARTRHVSLRSMLRQFPGRLVLASGGPRDLPDRQRTLRATIAWSYELLNSDEQRLFDRAGVFAGGFTAAAVGVVRAATGELNTDVSDGLEALDEQNLIERVRDSDDEPRYRMLETIREYALERLEACEESETARRAAAEYYLDLAERAELGGEGQAHWLRRLVADIDNFRAALAWCQEQGQRAMGLRLSLALLPLWQLRDHQLEARAWLDTFMAADGEVSPNLRAKGLLWQGLLLMRGIGDDASAAHLFEEALVLFREGDDLNGTSETLQAEGDLYRNQGDLERAGERYAESRELAQLAGDAYLVAHGWMGLALCAQEEGQFDAAQQYWELMLEWAERAGNEASVALALNGLGEMARYREDWKEAERSYERTLRKARELGNQWRTALALHNLGYVALGTGEPDQARTLFTNGLSLYQER